jgi:hypothetical protein
MDALLEAVKNIIEEAEGEQKLNYHLRVTIAKKAVAEKKIGDEKWLKSQIKHEHENLVKLRCYAEKYDYAPFILLDPIFIFYIKNYYGEKFFSLLKSFKEPENISKKWALHFCETVKQIGLFEVKKAKNVHHFVTHHPEWQNCKKVRKLVVPTRSLEEQLDHLH